MSTSGALVPLFVNLGRQFTSSFVWILSFVEASAREIRPAPDS